MFCAILGLVFIFSIFPVVPFAVVLTQEAKGTTAACGMAAVWYIVFPGIFAVLTWIDE